jgi:uncharacterized protein YkwD
MQPSNSADPLAASRTRRPSRWVPALIAAVAALAALGVAPLTGAATEAPYALEAAAPVVPIDTSTAEQAMLDLTNADRAWNGLAPLQLDPPTLDIARTRAASQLSVPTLSHYDATGELAFVGMLWHSGIGYQLAGENLARSMGLDQTLPNRVEQALMGSPMHRRNILEQTFTRVSIGAVSDDQGRVSFAEIFRAE